MATIGQIIYNVEDYNSSGGYISTSNQNTSNIISSISYGSDADSFERYQQDIIDIFGQNLVSLYSSGIFSKLGIQAPPGTKVILNDNKQIMIGRTGVYELDEDINITNLYFIRPKKYILDESSTQENLEKGKNGLEAAEAQRAVQLEALNAEKETAEKEADLKLQETITELNTQLEDGTLNEEDYYLEKAKAQLEYNEAIEQNETNYWNEYILIQTEYEGLYEEALAMYNIGLNGIYVLPSQLDSSKDPEVSDYEILYNIIIDFLY